MSAFWFFTKRILLLPVVLISAHFLSHGYAFLAIRVQLAQNPWGSGGLASPGFFTLYFDYLQRSLSGDFGFMPGGTIPIPTAVAQASLNSLGLFLLAFILSTSLGLALGFLAVKTNPPSIARWLSPITAVGLATPGFFVVSLFIAATIYYLMAFGDSVKAPLPLSGFGWDEHLILPLLALTIRPMAQIAHSSAALLTGEFFKQYIVAARSIGNTWSAIRRKHAFRNVLAPILTTIAGSMRYLIAELILVEWIFTWPGLGRLLSLTLIPPTTSTVRGFGQPIVYFLHPELLAAVLTVFGLVFFIIDTLSTGLSLIVDPRISAQEKVVFNG